MNMGRRGRVESVVMVCLGITGVGVTTGGKHQALSNLTELAYGGFLTCACMVDSAIDHTCLLCV